MINLAIYFVVVECRKFIIIFYFTDPQNFYCFFLTIKTISNTKIYFLLKKYVIASIKWNKFLINL